MAVEQNKVFKIVNLTTGTSTVIDDGWKNIAIFLPAGVTATVTNDNAETVTITTSCTLGAFNVSEVTRNDFKAVTIAAVGGTVGLVINGYVSI